MRTVLSDLFGQNDLPSANDDPVLALPFATKSQLSSDMRIGVVCHAFYPDLVEWLLTSAKQSLPATTSFFISTDTDAKAAELRLSLAELRRPLVVRVLPNRGRDIAPKLLGFSDLLDTLDVVLFIHAKRSPHASPLAGWRDFLLHNLAGTPEITASILSIFEHNPHVGLVAPQHFDPVRASCVWIKCLDDCTRLGRAMGFEITAKSILDFPSGSMFWARPQAIAPLLNLHLTWSDFPDELGQEHGTLAHAIERLFYFASEAAGFAVVKVGDPNHFENLSQFIRVNDATGLRTHLNERRLLTGDPRGSNVIRQVAKERSKTTIVTRRAAKFVRRVWFGFRRRYVTWSASTRSSLS